MIICVLDGWGYRAERSDNAIALANTPVWDDLVTNMPHAFLETSGLAVGLSEGQMGNSEVGHMNLGAGRVTMQDLPRIDLAINDGSLAKNLSLSNAISILKKNGGTMHLLGLLSPGGVHSHQNHMAFLAKVIAKAGIPVVIHVFLDGRDTPPLSAREFIENFMIDVSEYKVRIVTLAGRYYSMDRDKRWDRVNLAYQAIVEANGAKAVDPITAIEISYQAGKTDEFVFPVVIGDYDGIKNGDGLIMTNFRSDRVREILSSLVDPDFDGFSRSVVPQFSVCLGMNKYSTNLDRFLDALIFSENLTHTLGEVISDSGLTQLRIAETEKYAHVTFFFNGGQENVFPKEDRIMISSPKVATYDLQPEMSATKITDKLIEAIVSKKYDLIIVNYANCDMVGHTGILDATIKAVETVDQCLGRLTQTLKNTSGSMLITADHGNAELMRDPITKNPHTAHTIGKVQVILVNGPTDIIELSDGCLSDVAPTILELLNLSLPSQMTGKSLLVKKKIN
jgi:2,3-bisphosphoglycerate-independent phosphoglycerate mutase